MIKKAQFKIKGMQRDLSVSAFNPEFAYDNRNIRIQTTDDNTLFSVVNEKGTLETRIEGIGDYLTGIMIGKCELNNNLIVFTTNSKGSDNIYKLWLEGNTLKGESLLSTSLNLGFNTSNPIEAIGYYETEKIQKVYWVDGKNQPRVLNINKNDYNDANQFNFVPELKLGETITVSKNNIANGSFAPGVIQYAFSYYNKFGQESNIFYTTPLNYISHENRGGNPEDTISNSFNITLEGLDTSFDYVRIYSIHRSSLNMTPEVKLVKDVSTSLDKVIITDSGERGEIIDPTMLLYIGGEEIIASTISHKDNTLFLGDIKLSKTTFSPLEETQIKDCLTQSFTTRKMDYVEPKGYYSYKNSLDKNSAQIKTFKGGETYRIGIQFQHKNGKYSSPVFLEDIPNSIYPEILNDGINVAEVYVNNSGLADLPFIKDTYKRARLVMAMPTETDKTIVCQGVVCPTLYNLSDRLSNSPFVLSSWFMRPISIGKDNRFNLQYRHNMGLPDNSYRSAELQNTVSPRSPYIGIKENVSKSGEANFYYLFQFYYCSIVVDGRTYAIIIEKSYEEAKKEASLYIDEVDIPGPADWRKATDNKPIKKSITIESSSNEDLERLLSSQGENFYVDQSIVTFHSPEIEEKLASIDNANLKFRIVGMAQITSEITDHNITTSSRPRSIKSEEEVELNADKENLSKDSTGLINAPLWHDGLTEADVEADSQKTLFAIYPWHRSSSLNNDVNTDSSKRTAVLQRKIFSNIRFSYYTKYFSKVNSIWNPENGITQISIFNSDVISTIRIPKPLNSDLSDLNYYGNLDKLSFTKNKYPIQCVGKLIGNSIHNEVKKEYVANGEATDPISIKYKSTPHAVFAFNYTNKGSQVILPALNADDLSSNYLPYTGYTPWDSTRIKKEIRVLSFKQSSTPTPIEEYQWWFNDGTGEMFISIDVGGGQLSWSKDEKYIKQYYFKYDGTLYEILGSSVPYTMSKLSELIISQFNLEETSEYPFLYIGELYRDITDDPLYGGKSRSALQNNLWVPIGEPVAIDSDLIGTEGDTYFQRWDCLKTFAFTNEDTNSVVDITSFMVESRINLDGRYDRNRGQKNSTNVSPINFNLFNPVYNQTNNFFNYRILDEKFNLNEFPCSITWSKNKQAAENIDTWTNITMASVLDLDGDKGPVRALRRFNNTLIAFQDKGISQILYNENVQINAANGVPIEIANSGKVQGKRYLNDKIGCTNKWSICESPNGLYFVDDVTKGIYLFNGQVNNISDKYGFHSWINTKSVNINTWNPSQFNNCVLYHDKINNDVFIIYDDECLAFSETMGNFTSFYSYDGSPYFSNLQDRGIWFRKATYGSTPITKLFYHQEGNYNNFFGTSRTFSVEVIANPNPTTDKIFNTLEFRADSWDYAGNLLNSTFDTVRAYNEYQDSDEVPLSYIKRIPSNLKRKFRIWRANIPRDAKDNPYGATHGNRMRNSWLYIKLKMNKENTNKTILHDMVVDYFE